MFIMDGVNFSVYLVSPWKQMSMDVFGRHYDHYNRTEQVYQAARRDEVVGGYQKKIFQNFQFFNFCQKVKEIPRGLTLYKWSPKEALDGLSQRL